MSVVTRHIWRLRSIQRLTTRSPLISSLKYVTFLGLFFYQGIARTQSPTNKNYALELNTFGPIVRVSSPEVQWESLTLEEPPS